jgi:hypothetical protein
MRVDGQTGRVKLIGIFLHLSVVNVPKKSLQVIILMLL